MKPTTTSSSHAAAASLRGRLRMARTDSDLGVAPVQLWLALASNVVWWTVCVLAAFAAPVARAQALDAPAPRSTQIDTGNHAAWQAQIESLLRQQPGVRPNEASAPSKNTKPWRVEVVLGQLDPRLKLAPCEKVRAFVPDGVQMWGKTRVGLRCEQGPVRWNVYWPVVVKVWGDAVVAAAPLRPGAPINAADLRIAEVDLAAQTSPAVLKTADIVGRAVSHAMEPGQSLRQDDVKLRRWFAAGDPVRLLVRGQGFQVSSEGMALTPGDEGRCARVRTDAGRVVCAQPVGDRLVELAI